MKTLMIVGCGAQGTTIALQLDKEPECGSIICADYNLDAAKLLASRISKGTPVQMNAADKDDIVSVCKKYKPDMMVCMLPLDLLPIAMDAAIEAGVNYQDLSGTDALDKADYPHAIKRLYDEYGPRFEAAGLCALIGTGSAPGLTCMITREAMKYLDKCDTINVCVYEGVEAKRFMPFWWSAVTAIGDMTDQAYAFENGKHVETEPFSRPIQREFKGMEGKICTLVEHAHEEPVFMGFNADKYFKGAKNVNFKYGGVGIDFARPLYRAGLLSRKKEDIGGVMVAPFDVILKHIPEAPHTIEELKEILNEGLAADDGAMLVEAYGEKDGKQVKVENYCFAPGMADSFKREGLSGEQYLTGISASIFTDMMIRDIISFKGLKSSDMLEDDQVACFLEMAAKYDIVTEVTVK